MAIAVEMPKLSDTMEEGVVSAWMADEGDQVSSGDVIAQVETDKATMDLEVFDDGVLLKKVVEEGESVPLGKLIAVLGEEGEDISDLLAEHGEEAAGGDGAEAKEADADEDEDAEVKDADREAEDEAASKEERGKEQAEEDEEAEQEAQPAASEEKEKTEAPSGDGAAQEAEQPAEAQRSSSENGRVKASPLARKLAGEHGIELSSVEGTGPQGRIVKRDIEARLEEGEAAPAEEAPEKEKAPAGGDGRAYQTPAEVSPQEAGALYESEKISQMRKTIARRLAESKYTAPHFYLTVDIDTAAVEAFREDLNALAESQERGRISLNDFITKACAVALRQHPEVNASYLEKEGEIRHYNAVHVAVAVAIDEGLLTPVIRNADQKGLAQIAEETKELAGKARERKLQPEEFEGSTFTTSNLGMFGIEEFTAIINPPNACILAIGTIRDEPVVSGGEVVPGRRMKVTLSCDHRVVDGAKGADFLATLKGLLEEPLGLLL